MIAFLLFERYEIKKIKTFVVPNVKLHLWMCGNQKFSLFAKAKTLISATNTIWAVVLARDFENYFKKQDEIGLTMRIMLLA